MKTDIPNCTHSHFSLEALQVFEPLEGFEVKFVHSARVTLAFWSIRSGSILPEHHHEQEQTIFVESGEFELNVSGKIKIYSGGNCIVIGSNELHAGRAITDCKIIDVFCPVREDYISLPLKKYSK